MDADRYKSVAQVINTPKLRTWKLSYLISFIFFSVFHVFVKSVTDCSAAIRTAGATSSVRFTSRYNSWQKITENSGNSLFIESKNLVQRSQQRYKNTKISRENKLFWGGGKFGPTACTPQISTLKITNSQQENAKDCSCITKKSFCFKLLPNPNIFSMLQTDS